MKKINVVLPVYNEVEVIPDFNAELFKVLDGLGGRYRYEVIYVLDKSPDGTLEALKRIAAQRPEVRVIALSRRFGHQHSLVAGMDACDGDVVIMMDSDLEHPPALIPAMLAKYEEGYHIVQTKRVYHENVSPFKKFASHAFYRLISRISSVPISEDAADFRLISRQVLSVFQSNIREQHQFLRGLFPWVGFNTATVEFVSRRRSKGRSKYTLSRMIAFAVVGIVAFSKMPLQLSIYIGLAMSILAILHGIVMTVMYFFTSTPPAGWTTLVALVSFLGGLQLVVLGIIGEYIGAIFDEVKQRPLYIIEEQWGFQRAEE